MFSISVQYDRDTGISKGIHIHEIPKRDSEMDLDVPGLRGAGLSRGDVSTPYNVSLSASGTCNGK